MADPSNSSVDHDGHSHHSHHHAHFVVPKEDDLSAHDSQILLEHVDENKINVRLGFLQIKHIYEVRFSVNDNLGKDTTFQPLENLNAKIESVTPTAQGTGHDVVIIFSAMKEKIMQETVTYSCSKDPKKKITLVLHARVLGKGKGTPSLKKGIHCIKVELDEESDASDWQGF
ncbi:adipose-secreted signaling protein-like [Physella acuta]|uniref:adipose-secreted signaling protein-like n=1 Tax=Physella acuta TaxID=109671 RepID=UPI0027DDCD75|nr:adipose-secreted signaling protein-like [Physella acuta]XP_059147549.1 adipose-secreted signaling protein-like [Physella acuta]